MACVTAASCATQCIMRMRLRKSWTKWMRSSRRVRHRPPIKFSCSRGLLLASDEELLVSLAAGESAFARDLLERGFIVHAAFLHDFRHATRQRNFRARIFGRGVL